MNYRGAVFRVIRAQQTSQNSSIKKWTFEQHPPAQSSLVSWNQLIWTKTSYGYSKRKIQNGDSLTASLASNPQRKSSPMNHITSRRKTARAITVLILPPAHCSPTALLSSQARTWSNAICNWKISIQFIGILLTSRSRFEESAPSEPRVSSSCVGIYRTFSLSLLQQQQLQSSEIDDFCSAFNGVSHFREKILTWVLHGSGFGAAGPLAVSCADETKRCR